MNREDGKSIGNDEVARRLSAYSAELKPVDSGTRQVLGVATPEGVKAVLQTHRDRKKVKPVRGYECDMGTLEGKEPVIAYLIERKDEKGHIFVDENGAMYALKPQEGKEQEYKDFMQKRLDLFTDLPVVSKERTAATMQRYFSALERYGIRVDDSCDNEVLYHSVQDALGEEDHLNTLEATVDGDYDRYTNLLHTLVDNDGGTTAERRVPRYVRAHLPYLRRQAQHMSEEVAASLGVDREHISEAIDAKLENFLKDEGQKRPRQTIPRQKKP